MDDRRASDSNNQTDTATLLAVLYTIGYFGIVFLMMTRGIPKDNEGSLNQLIGALTIIQTGIIGFYFGGSKANEKTQAANVARSLRSEAVVQEIAKATPVATAAAVAATVAATTAAATPGAAIPLVPVEVPPEGTEVQPPQEQKP